NSGLFNVSLSADINSDMTVKVFNTLGELVKTVVVNNNATEVNMTDCAAGVYMVKVYAENQVATKKITITK
ncbi:MAG: Secretion system C-terminal sorting domain, partial [Bacteroidota bacterium]